MRRNRSTLLEGRGPARFFLILQNRRLIGGALLLCILLTSDRQATGETRGTLTQHQKTSVFSNTVSWYTPPSDNLQPRQGVTLPYQLFNSVAPRFRAEATSLLSGDPIISISLEQAAHLASPIDVDEVVASRVEDLEKQLRYVGDQARAEKAYKLMRLDKEEIESKRRMARTTIRILELEIQTLRRWKGHLKPYLIRAVALKAGGSFDGVVVFNELVVGYTAMGTGPLPMENCPIVGYLPTKPRHVYTVVGITE